MSGDSTADRPVLRVVSGNPTPEEIAELVRPRSRDLPGPVRRCPDCGRVYWPGSHARRMTVAVDRVFVRS